MTFLKAVGKSYSLVVFFVLLGFATVGVLSAVLHNDTSLFSNEWEEMTPIEALEYYSAREVCLMYGSEVFGHFNCDSFELTIEPKCAIQGGGRDFPGDCGVNLAAKYRRKDFKGWPLSHDALDVANWMIKKKWNTLVFFGDSVTKQQITDLECAFQRNGYGTLFPWPCDTDNGAGAARRRCDSDSSTGVAENKNGFLDELGSFYVYDKQESNTSAYNLFSTVSDLYLDPAKHKRPLLRVLFNRVEVARGDFKFMNTVLNSPFIEGKAVIVFNIGLHYNNYFDQSTARTPKSLRDDYKKWIEYVFSTDTGSQNNEAVGYAGSSSRSPIVNKTVLFYRETSAQHFKTPDGLYTQAMESNLNDIRKQSRDTRQADAITNLLVQGAAPFTADTASTTNSLRRHNGTVPMTTAVEVGEVSGSPGDEMTIARVEEIKAARRSAIEALLADPLYNYQCKPLDSINEARLNNWRNSVFHEEYQAFQEERAGEGGETISHRNRIHVLPFFKYTLPRFDLHSRYNDQVDCTHFCRTPLLWLPVWDAMYKTLNALY